MGGHIDPNTKYGSPAAFIFVFNLVIGAGALALPLGFHIAGLVLGTIVLVVLCFLSYVTVTFMIEALSIANALKHPKAAEFDGEIDVQPLLTDNCNEDESGESRHRRRSFVVTPGLAPGSSEEADFTSLYTIEKRVEVSEMAGIFLGFWGEKLFFFVIVLYLYGDLAIYAVSIPTSLLQVTGSWTISETLPCCSHQEVFWFYMAGFVLIIGPFCFFDIQQTKWLQYTTMLIRNASLFTMIILATIYVAQGKGMNIHDIPSGQWVSWSGFPQVFGVAIYAFMCHHSLPGIITPMTEKKNVFKIMGLDMIAILMVYLFLVWTAVFAFGDNPNPTCKSEPGPACALQALYTLNFASYEVHPLAIFLVLFPVFTLSTNFPLIAITLRNNLMHLITWRQDSVTPQFRSIIFTLITLVPPFAIATATQNISLLVQITGAYAGLAIMFVFPTVFVHFGRIKAQRVFGDNHVNPYRSPFSHFGWIVLIYAWTVFALGCQIYRQVITAQAPPGPPGGE